MSEASVLDERFEEESRVLLGERISTVLVVGAFVFPAFVFQDYRLVQGRWQDMLALRLAGALLCMLLFAVNKTAAGQRRPFAVICAGAAGLSVLKTFITPLEVVGVGSLYFGGHVLILVAGLSFLPLATGQALVLALLVHLGFTLPMLAFGHPIDAIAFSTQNSLMVAIWMLLCVGCHLNHQGRRREFELRHRLYGARQRALDYG